MSPLTFGPNCISAETTNDTWILSPLSLHWDLSLDRSFILLVSVFTLYWAKQDTSPLRGSVLPFLRDSVCLCVAGKQKVTVRNGPDLEVGMKQLCVCAFVFCVCVCGFVAKVGWWQLRRNGEVQLSVPSWCPCHFMALFLSLNFR